MMDQNFGQFLKNIREERGISLEEVFTYTRIRVSFLKALEEDDYEALPSIAHARGFLRSYAGYLNVDTDAWMNQITPPDADVESQPEVEESQEDATAEIINDAPPAEAIATIEIPPEMNTSKTDIEELDDDYDYRKTSIEVDDDDSITQAEPLPVIENAAPTLPENNQPEDGNEPVNSATMLKEIGALLKERRELLSISEEKIEALLKIKPYFIRAMEEGDFDLLPSLVQARGMLQTYAELLNLNTDMILMRYAEALQQRRLEHIAMMNVQPEKSSGKARQKKIPVKRVITFDMIFGTILIFGFLTFFIWGGARIINAQKTSEIAPTLPAVVEILVDTPQMVMEISQTDSSLTPQAETPNQTSESNSDTVFVGDSFRPIQILVSARRTVWVRITSDDKVEFQGRLTPGTAYQFGANTKLEVLTANAAALSITIGNRDLGTMGTTGQVRNLIFTIQGLVEPTATPTPTPTETPIHSPTPTLTPTAETPAPTETP